jgi:hypothetical protein
LENASTRPSKGERYLLTAIGETAPHLITDKLSGIARAVSMSLDTGRRTFVNHLDVSGARSGYAAKVYGDGKFELNTANNGSPYYELIIVDP